MCQSHLNDWRLLGPDIISERGWPTLISINLRRQFSGPSPRLSILTGHSYIKTVPAYFVHFICPSIEFLVHLGEKPYGRINNGNCAGVFRILASQPESESRDAEARLLLGLGAHPYMLADDGGR